MTGLEIEHTIRRVGDEDARAQDRRFKLIAIAFEQVLRANQADLLYTVRHTMIAGKAVSLADAAMAEMEKKPDNEKGTSEDD